MKNIIPSFKFYNIILFYFIDNHIAFVLKNVHLKWVINLPYLTLKQLLITKIASQTTQQIQIISMKLEIIFPKFSLLRQVTIELRLIALERSQLS